MNRIKINIHKNVYNVNGSWTMRKNLKLLFLTLLLSFYNLSDSHSQITSHEDKRQYFKADNAFEYGDFLLAKEIYESLHVIDSNNADINFKLGFICFSIKKFKPQSKKYFDKVSTNDYPEVNYYLGQLHHLSKNFEKATYYYNQYLSYKGEKEHSQKEVNDLINKANTAVLFESIPDKAIKIKNIGDSINTKFAEYAPLIPADENFMLFTSRRENSLYSKKDPLDNYFEDIYVSYKRDSVWTSPKMLNTNINTEMHDAGTGLSADGENLFMYRTAEDLISGNIYVSSFKDSTWSMPVILGSNVNSEHLETSACFSAEGDVIYFSSNRPGGYGGKDIYRAKKLPNGDWGKPYNLGPKINTEYNEDAPFIHPLGNVLYFSSEGHKNMGGFDVFKTEFDESVGFTVPENLGSPINTVDDDIFFVTNADASTGYFSSGRGGGFGDQDIYEVKLKSTVVPLEVYNIYVKNDSLGVLKNVHIEVIDTVENQIVGQYKSNPISGKILVISPEGKENKIVISADGFKPYKGTVAFADNREMVYMVSKIEEIQEIMKEPTE